MQGRTVPKAGKGDEIQISKFSLTEKQRELRDALSKRLVLSESLKSFLAFSFFLFLFGCFVLFYLFVLLFLL